MEGKGEIKANVDKVLEVLRDKELKKPGNKQKRREKIRKVLRQNFNYEEMSKRALAVHWKKRTPVEKKGFISLFRDLLERSYIKRIEEYTDENVVYAAESIDGDYAEVKTKIITERKVEIPINYRLLKSSTKWKVYDVVIEGISLIKNYRTQFNKIIRSKSFEALIKRMKNKQEEEESLEQIQ
ncbi:MAG: ABC transporter substrate-binding protein [Candidatus Mariimomonas ferrooxydans]